MRDGMGYVRCCSFHTDSTRSRPAAHVTQSSKTAKTLKTANTPPPRFSSIEQFFRVRCLQERSQQDTHHSIAVVCNICNGPRRGTVYNSAECTSGEWVLQVRSWSCRALCAAAEGNEATSTTNTLVDNFETLASQRPSVSPAGPS